MPLLKALLAAGDTVVTRGRTRDNVLNLPRAFLDKVEGTYAGTRLGRQELDGELIEDAPGALWTRTLIEGCRVRAAPGCARVVVAVDPPAGASGIERRVRDRGRGQGTGRARLCDRGPQRAGAIARRLGARRGAGGGRA